MVALRNIFRALVSYIVPQHFETKAEYPPNVGGWVTLTHTRWELRRGKVHPIDSISSTVHSPHPDCRCKLTPGRWQ